MQESTDVKLTKEVKGLLTGQQKQNTELEEIRKKADTPRVGKSINQFSKHSLIHLFVNYFFVYF